MSELTEKRFEVLQYLVDRSSWLNWDGAEWWTNDRDESLHAATCHWLVRNNYVAWDAELNDNDGQPMGVICYTPTKLGIRTVARERPAAQIISFRP